MKRRVWLIATATASTFFVLYAPLCALACLTPADSTSISETTDTSDTTHTSPPCHGPAPSSSPAEPAGPPDLCDCEEPGGAALLSSGQTPFSHNGSVAVLSPTASSSLLAPGPVRVSRGHPEATDLPPPDILLRKSTLLI